MTGALVARLADGRLHLQHGPIDVILGAAGTPAAVAAGERAVAARFTVLLAELAAELPALRSPAPVRVHGPVAQAMAAAVAPHAAVFVTPMAAVAGAVADALVAAFVAGAADGAPGGLRHVHANNGGDIALHLEPGEVLRAAIAARPGLPDRIRIASEDPVRGIATSGWGGRSLSLGIADAVTVLAGSAAAADAAATLIANAVDLPGHPAVARRPARDIQADSDLGDRPVTVGVGPLGPEMRAQALARGLAVVEGMRARGLIVAAALFLQGDTVATGGASVLPQSG